MPNIPLHRAVISILSLHCLTRKTWVQPLEFRFNHVYELRYRTVHLYFRLMAAIFDLPVTPTSASIHTSITVLLDPENVGVAVGVLLLFHIEAEIYEITYVLPIIGGHLCFISHSDVGEYSHKFRRVAEPRKCGSSRWNLVAI